MWAEVMGISVDYDDDDERRRTHPLLLPKIESVRISVTDGEILEKFKIVTPLLKFFPIPSLAIKVGEWACARHHHHSQLIYP